MGPDGWVNLPFAECSLLKKSWTISVGQHKSNKHSTLKYHPSLLIRIACTVLNRREKMLCSKWASFFNILKDNPLSSVKDDDHYNQHLTPIVSSKKFPTFYFFLPLSLSFSFPSFWAIYNCYNRLDSPSFFSVWATHSILLWVVNLMVWLRPDSFLLSPFLSLFLSLSLSSHLWVVVPKNLLLRCKVKEMKAVWAALGCSLSFSWLVGRTKYLENGLALSEEK